MKLMFLKYIVCFQLLLLNTVSAQTYDSQNINFNENFETGKFNHEKAKYSESIDQFSKASNYFAANDNMQMLAECYNYIAKNHYYLGDYNKALLFFKKSETIYRKLKYKKGIASTVNNRGGIHYYLGNYLNALELYTLAISIQTEIGDKKAAALTSQNIGGIYSKIGDYVNAMKYYQKSLATYYETDDNKAIAQGLNAIGFIHIKKHNYTKAKKVLQEAKYLAEKEDDIQLKIEILSNLGELYYNSADYNNSLFYYKECLKHSTQTKNLQYIADSRIGIGNIYNESKKSKNAIGMCTTAMDISNKLQSISLKKDVCDCLYIAYKHQQDNKNALYFYEMANIYNDSLRSEETANHMINMEFQNKKLIDSIAYVKRENILQLKHNKQVQQKEAQRNTSIVVLSFIVILLVGLWNRLRFVRRAKRTLQFEKNRSENLLLNILPEEIAEELKEKGSVNARDFNLVTVLFSDFKSFTATAERMTPKDLVEELNICFKAFDLIAEKYSIEKIKTIGDSYMAAGGIPIPTKNFILNTVLAAIEMKEFVIQRKKENDLLGKPAFEMRIGIHAGPIIAGIVGVKKFQYDVWGDTVNTASRIESNGTVGKVNVSKSIYHLLKDQEDLEFRYRGKIHAKGKGNVDMYFVDLKRNNTPLIHCNSLSSKN